MAAARTSSASGAIASGGGPACRSSASTVLATIRPAAGADLAWLGVIFLSCATILTIWTSNAVVAPLVKLARQAERFPR